MQNNSVPDGVLKEVATEGAYITSESIKLFVEIANEQFPTRKMYHEFKMRDLDNYEAVGENNDDIQILSNGEMERDVVGHWICVRYKGATQTVYVYDSLFRKRLNMEQKEIIQQLYPKRNGSIVYFQQEYVQTDYTSSGIFAMFYASILLMGEDPKTHAISLNHVIGDPSIFMRLSLLEMFANHQLALFA